MTFRTIDIDTNTLGATSVTPSAPVRSVRSRRHSAVMRRTKAGARIAGFGF